MTSSYHAKRTRTEAENDDPLPTSSKRWQPSRDDSNYPQAQAQLQLPTRLSNKSYTVGWICALPLEMAAAQAMLDHLHEPPPQDRADTNKYILGSIGRQNVAITCLPKGHYGTNNAATVASHMHRSFPSMFLLLMVGIGGGIPGKVDVRLGDVVVGTRVVQFDLGWATTDGQFQRTESSFTPPHTLLTAVSKLDAKRKATSRKVSQLLARMLEQHPDLAEYRRPATSGDLLFVSSYEHKGTGSDCLKCDKSKLVTRPSRPDAEPVVHHGTIASANRGIKHGMTRDQLAQELDIICFEMESAGLGGDFPCLAIRGICDYSDSHKNKKWQEYAAATAAAYAKELLLIMPQELGSEEVTVAAPRSITEQSSRRESRQYLLNSLSFKHIDARESNIKPAYRETCKWLLEHPDYVNWLDPDQYRHNHGFLWIKGKPGAGKSTLMKFIKDRTNMGLDNNEATITFFFNARGDALEKSTLGMHMSLLLQLLEKFPDLQEVLDDPRLLRLHSTEYEGDNIWEIGMLCDIFSAATENLRDRVLFCLIDALDECDMDQVRDMVDFFEELGQRAVRTGSKLYVCLSSRHYPQISIQHGRQLTLENQDGHSQDLDKYVRSKFKAGQGKLFEETRDEIIQKAAGIFMWVVLVIPILNKEFERGRIFAVKKKLKEIPAGLSELFRDILKKDNENMDEFWLCIQWLLYSKRPITFQEFYFAVISGLNQDPEEIARWEPEHIPKQSMKQFVLSSSKGLAEVTNTKSAIVQFIHESVRDFLIKDKGLWELWPELPTEIECLSNDQLKLCCSAYLKVNSPRSMNIGTPLPKASSEMGKNLRERISREYPFLEYATHYVLHHADVAADQFPQKKFLKSFPRKDWICLDNLFQKYEIRRHTDDASLFYILAEHNWARLIRSLPQIKTRTHDSEERYQFPLMAALVNGHRDAVEALLQRDTDDLTKVDSVTCPPPERDSDELKMYDKAVLWAVKKDRGDMLPLLLKTGRFDINQTYTGHRTVLHQAVSNGQETIVKILLDTGQVDLNCQDNHGNTPLFLAVEREEKAIIKMLLETGEADVNSAGRSRERPLSAAVSRGNEAIVKMLLETGQVDVNAVCINMTPIYLAVLCEYEGIVKMLLETGQVEVNKDRFGEKPLFLAISEGHEAIVKIFLETGQVKINGKNSSSRTPLNAACFKGHQVIVKMLLEMDQIDINMPDRNQRTPLLAACSGGHEGIVKMLLEMDQIDINAPDESNRTPLFSACRHKHESIVGMLLEMDQIDVNLPTKHDWTPLYSACLAEHEGIINMLLKSGKLNVDEHNNYGFSRDQLVWLKEHHPNSYRLLYPQRRL